MRTFLTFLTILAAQHDISRPQPSVTIYRYSRCADGTYREDVI